VAMACCRAPMAVLIAAFNSRWYALENVSVVLQCSDHGKREVM
jgi:hypothetical protein